MADPIDSAEPLQPLDGNLGYHLRRATAAMQADLARRVSVYGITIVEMSALLVIEAIPMFVCADCGESYFSASTLHEIERIKALRKSVAVSRPVPVASFRLVAG